MGFGFPKFDYSFSVWPDEQWNFPKAMYDVFQLLKGRVGMTFTEDEFESFRRDLACFGFTLREIERVPYHEPQGIL